MSNEVGKKLVFTVDVQTDDGILFTTATADEQSVDFSTTNQDGAEFEPSFELTWPEIFQACKEYMEK